jgi:hypothetical protein
VRSFAYDCVEGFVGEGGVFGATDENLVWAGVDEDDSDVDDDDDSDVDDDLEVPLEVNESSELDDTLRPLWGKYLGFVGEGDRDISGR